MTSLLVIASVLTLFNTIINPINSFSISPTNLVSKSIVKNPYDASSTSTSSSTSLHATWSNGQAVKEYQDFLASGKQEIEKEKDGASIIVKSTNPTSPTTPIVDALVKLGNGDDIILTPNEPLPQSMAQGMTSYPIYIAIPPHELHDFIKNLNDDWKVRIEDFVFLSGGPICGVIEPILKTYGYARDTMTQVLITGFTLPPQGFPGKPRDLSCNIGTDAGGNEKIAGECAACGKWSGAIQERLEENDIRCKVGFYRDWRRMMWERAAFDAVFNLVGALRDEPTTLKDVALYYEAEVSDMLWEVTGKLRGMLAVTLLYGFEERLFGFAERRFGEQQCELDDDMFPYMFCPPFDQSNKIVEYLNYAKDEKGMIPNASIKPCSTLPSLMRPGNLRADGVL